MNRHFGRATLCGLAGLAAVACMVTPAVAEDKKPAVDSGRPLIPVEEFARAPQYESAQLSPDGKYVGYIVQKNDSSGIGFLDVETGKTEILWAQKDRTFGFKNDVYSFEWVGNRRVVMATSLGWVGVDADRSHLRYLTGMGRWADEHSGQASLDTPLTFSPSALIRDQRYDPKRILVAVAPSYVGAGRTHPDIFRLNTETGTYGLVMKNPGNVSAWQADWDGEVRFGITTDGITTQLIHRNKGSDKWSAPLAFGPDTRSHSFAGLDADGETLYVFKANAQGRAALYSHNLATGETKGPLFQHEKYDIEAAIFSPKHRRLLGVRYVTEGPRQYWFEPEFAALQKQIDAAHPGLMNLIVSMDRELRTLLVFSFSAREPGYYTLINLAEGKSRPIAIVRPWIKPETQADMFPVKCAARDGLELNGYLTLPAGRGQKNHPMIVYVHGGPYGVRDEWGYDPIVQFLANRGYAVLQVNYRGSGGYGDDFYIKGRHEIGLKIEDDIEDMTRWAVKQGFADPRRLAIMGASYGGYSTLMSLARTPDLFRCGVACAAVSNWVSLANELIDEHQTEALNWWRLQIGDFDQPEWKAKLAAVSPVNLAPKITAPLLIMHGEVDGRVPFRQAEAMAAALKKAGHPPETQFFEHLGHSLPTDTDGVAFLTKLEAFLAKHLAP